MPDNNAQGHKAEYNVVINGDPKVVHGQKMSFDHVVELAFPGASHGGNIRYTVGYSTPDGTEGSLVRGQNVDLVEGMIFDVDNTDKS